MTELVIAYFLILEDKTEIVKASLTGSILGNLLLVLGLSFLAGGLKHEEQTYNARSASIHATSLVLAVTALLMPRCSRSVRAGRARSRSSSSARW